MQFFRGLAAKLLRHFRQACYSPFFPGQRRVSHSPSLECLEDRTLLSFATARSYDVGPHPTWVEVGDFNNDGIPDLVTTNQGASPSSLDGTVSVLLGNGDGSFQS